MLVTPVARRRPQALAKQVATLDVLSGGRVTLGVGLGWADPTTSTAASATPRTRSSWPRRLDEALPLLTGVLVGQAGVALPARTYTVEDVDAAAADGAAATSADLGRRLLAEPAADATGRRDGTAWCRCSRSTGTGPCHPSSLVTEMLSYVGEQRGSLDGYDVVLGGGDRAVFARAEVVGPLAEAGCDVVGRAAGAART